MVSRSRGMVASIDLGRSGSPSRTCPRRSRTDSALERRPAVRHLHRGSRRGRRRRPGEVVNGPPVALRPARGAHVGGRADDRVGEGRGPVGPGPAGQAEVGNVRDPSAIDEDVRRLEIEMEDSPAMGIVHSPGDDRDQPGRGGSGPGSGPVVGSGEVPPSTSCHGEVGPAVVLADIVDWHDVRVVEVRGGLGLAAEPAEVVGRCEPPSTIILAPGPRPG